MIFTTLQFKRKEKSEWEDGYAIGHDVGDIIIIIDKQGVEAKEVWNYKISQYPKIFIQLEA